MLVFDLEFKNSKKSFGISGVGDRLCKHSKLGCSKLACNEFSKFTKFAQCMLDVLREIEGIAHQPELDEELKRNAGGEDFAKWRTRFIDIRKYTT